MISAHGIKSNKKYSIRTACVALTAPHKMNVLITLSEKTHFSIIHLYIDLFTCLLGLNGDVLWGRTGRANTSDLRSVVVITPAQISGASVGGVGGHVGVANAVTP